MLSIKSKNFVNLLELATLDINTINGQISKTDIQRPNLFWVMFTPPSNITDTLNANAESRSNQINFDSIENSINTISNVVSQASNVVNSLQNLGSQTLLSFINNFYVEEQLSYYVKNINIPIPDIETTDIYKNGRMVPVATSITPNNTLKLTMNDDGIGMILQFFTIWKDAIGNYDNNIFNYKSDYQGAIDIFVLGIDMVPIYRVTYENIFPTKISISDRNFSSKNSFAEISIDFKFDRPKFEIYTENTLTTF